MDTPEILEWLLSLAGAAAAALLVRFFVFELVWVRGCSMMDTLSHGEIVFVTKYEYAAGGHPRRFDVVICRYPGRGRARFVKRIAALPGETLELRKGILYIDGRETGDPFIPDLYRTGWKNTFGPFTVPEGHYFVLGDHRNASNDSRSVGPLPRKMIRGHVRSVLFPFRRIRRIR